MPVAVGKLGGFFFGASSVSVLLVLRARIILLGFLRVGILLIAAIIFRTNFGSRAQNPEIMLSMLVIIFRHDGVSAGHGFLGERLVLIHDLLGISANL